MKHLVPTAHIYSQLQEDQKALGSAVIWLKVASCWDSSGMKAEHHFGVCNFFCCANILEKRGGRTPNFRVAETAVERTYFPGYGLLWATSPSINQKLTHHVYSLTKITSLISHFRARASLWLNLHSSHCSTALSSPIARTKTEIPVHLETLASCL